METKNYHVETSLREFRRSFPNASVLLNAFYKTLVPSVALFRTRPRNKFAKLLVIVSNSKRICFL
jgi:hypothetical protein